VPEITEQGFPWPPASATGVGSLPGTDPAEALRLVFGELPDLPHLTELPARGPGADLTGRTAGLLVGLPAELTPAGWRFTARPGRDLRRAQGLLSADLDALEEVAAGYQGPLKIQVCGPWTLAATIELSRSQDPALADAGAVADLTASLAEGVAAHVADVRRRIPGAHVLLQLDEPALPAVLAGRVPTASGLNRLPVPEESSLEAGLGAIISAGATFTVVHCSAMSVPFGMIKSAGAGGAGCDLGKLQRAEEEALAEAVEAGLGILAGVVPGSDQPARRPSAAIAAGRDIFPGAEPPEPRDSWSRSPGPAQERAGDVAKTERAGAARPPSARQVAERVIELWRRMGWPTARGGPESGPAGVAGQVVLTPACGMAGATPGYARDAMARCREAARLLPELIEEGRA
jgi:hypothetical protein